MPSPIRKQIAPPLNWQDFETLCADLFQWIWNDPLTKLHGRSGQNQHGVDIYGQLPGTEEWQGVQCKGKDGRYGAILTEREIIEEVEKAKKFRPMLASFTIVTTAQSDAKTEHLARQITAEHSQLGLFRVEVLGWDEIVRRMTSNEELFDKYYPNQSSKIEEIRKKLSQLTDKPFSQVQMISGLHMDSYCPACGTLIPKEVERCYSCTAQIVSGATEQELKDGMLFGGFGGAVVAAMIFKAFEYLSIQTTLFLIGIGIIVGAGLVQHTKRGMRRYLKPKI